MARLGEHGRRSAVLDDAPGIHDRDPVGDRGDDGKVVRDVDDREAELALESPHLSEQPCLRHDVEAGRRLVHQHDGWPADESRSIP